MNTHLHLLILQPPTAAANEQPVPSPQSESPAARLSPLAKAQVEHDLYEAYCLLRDVCDQSAARLSLEQWISLTRAKDYCGWRFNSVRLGGTNFPSPEWRSR